MGLRPCMVCQRFYRGTANHVYPAMVQGSWRDSRKLAVCDEHAAQLTGWADIHMTVVDMDAPPTIEYEAAVCPQCEQQIDGEDAMLFMTAYVRGQERRDYFGRAHAACAESLKWAMGLATQNRFWGPPDDARVA